MVESVLVVEGDVFIQEKRDPFFISFGLQLFNLFLILLERRSLVSNIVMKTKSTVEVAPLAMFTLYQ